MSNYKEITYRVDRRIAFIGLNRPESLNAYTPTMGEELFSAVAQAADSSDVRVIVLTGNGRGFCAGADMRVLQAITPGGERKPEPGIPQISRPVGSGPDVSAHYRSRFGYMMNVPKPIIAAINGPAAGLGLIMALYADIRFAGSDAKFTTSFAQRGLVAEHGISWLLPRLVGQANALDLLLSARKFGAAEAERIGLVNRAIAQASLMDEVTSYALALADTVSPRSMAVMKAQLWKSQFQDFNDALALADGEMSASFATADFKEGVAHFVEKRPAAFTGR